MRNLVWTPVLAVLVAGAMLDLPGASGSGNPLPVCRAVSPVERDITIGYYDVPTFVAECMDDRGNNFEWHIDGQGMRDKSSMSQDEGIWHRTTFSKKMGGTGVFRVWLQATDYAQQASEPVVWNVTVLDNDQPPTCTVLDGPRSLEYGAQGAWTATCRDDGRFMAFIWKLNGIETRRSESTLDGAPPRTDTYEAVLPTGTHALSIQAQDGHNGGQLSNILQLVVVIPSPPTPPSPTPTPSPAPIPSAPPTPTPSTPSPNPATPSPTPHASPSSSQGNPPSCARATGSDRLSVGQQGAWAAACSADAGLRTVKVYVDGKLTAELPASAGAKTGSFDFAHAFDESGRHILNLVPEDSMGRSGEMVAWTVLVDPPAGPTPTAIGLPVHEEAEAHTLTPSSPDAPEASPSGTPLGAPAQVPFLGPVGIVVLVVAITVSLRRRGR